MAITATLPPPPITADDIERAAARTSYNPITREIFEFPAQSSLPRLDGISAARAAELIEDDHPYAPRIAGYKQLMQYCTMPRLGWERCRPNQREQAVAWQVIPEQPERAAQAACEFHLPPLPAPHWYKYQGGYAGNGNGNAAAAIFTYGIIAGERRRIARFERQNGGAESAAYYQGRLDIAMPYMLGILARRAGLPFDAYAPKPLPEQPGAAPAAAAEQAGVDDLPGNRTGPQSIASRIRAAFTR